MRSKMRKECIRVHKSEKHESRGKCSSERMTERRRGGREKKGNYYPKDKSHLFSYPSLPPTPFLPRMPPPSSPPASPPSPPSLTCFQYIADCVLLLNNLVTRLVATLNVVLHKGISLSASISLLQQKTPHLKVQLYVTYT